MKQFGTKESAFGRIDCSMEVRNKKLHYLLSLVESTTLILAGLRLISVHIIFDLS